MEALSPQPFPTRERVLIVAGEPSGDRHAAALVRALRALPEFADMRFEGIAGPLLRAEGVTALVPMEDVAVVGVVEVLAHLPALWSARRALLAALRAPGTRLLIAVDYPGFNLPLCEAARARGVPTFYYIAPQVWAWGKGRLTRMRRAIDRLAVILPFEEAVFRAAGIAATYVGHPLVEALDPAVSRADFAAELGWPAERRFAALLPGSRTSELSRLAPAVLGAGARLLAARPEAGLVVAAASPEQAEALTRAVARHPELGARAGDVRVVRDRTREALTYARAAIVASGTATLECAALGTPLVVVYRLAAPTYAIARRLVRIPRFALCNIVAGEDVAPELLQGAANPARIVDALLPLWDEGPPREAARVKLARVRGLLGPAGASARAAACARDALMHVAAT